MTGLIVWLAICAVLVAAKTIQGMTRSPEERAHIAAEDTEAWEIQQLEERLKETK